MRNQRYWSLALTVKLGKLHEQGEEESMPGLANSGNISDVGDVFKATATAGLVDPHHAHLRYWFRGHPRDDYDLRPGVYRSDFAPCANESGRLTKEQHLTQDFRVNSAGLLRGDEEDAEVYFLQQHYRMPTRLLDWTHNPLAALFFAVSKNVEDNGSLLMMDAYMLATTQGIDPKVFRGIATSRQPIFKERLIPIFEWKSDENGAEFIIPVRPDHFDRRISFQRSCFTCHGPKRQVLTQTENGTLHSFRIPADKKPHLRDQLSLLGVTDFSVFGDLESLSRSLKRAHSVGD